MRRGIVIVAVLLIFFTVVVYIFAGEQSLLQDEKIDNKEVVESEKVQLTFLYSSNDVNWMSTIEELAQNFMYENPDIILNLESADKGVYNENLKIKEALGEFPDIFEIQNPYMFEQADMLGVIPKSISELVNNAIVINNNCYATPLYSTTYGIIYNRLMFKEYGISVPDSYQTFIEACEKLKQEGVTPIAIGGSKQDYMTYWLNYFYQMDVVSVHSDWLSDKNAGKVSVAEPEIKQMFQHYQSLFDAGYVHENFINMNDSEVISSLIEEEVAMVYTGPWLFSQIAEAYPDALVSDKNNLGKDVPINDSVKFQLGWFFMPDQKGDAVVINVRESNWAISAACTKDRQKAQAAEKFLQYYYSVENYRKVLQSMNAVPTTKAAVLYPSDSIQRELLMQYSYADVKDHYIGDYDTPEEVKTYLYQLLPTLVASKQINYERMLEQLDEKWNDSLQDRGDADEKE